jgi:hypothetical protein
LDDRIEVLGAFTNHQAEACRNLLHKVPAETAVIIGPWADGTLLDETSETAFCEWGVFTAHPDDEFELLEVFAFRSAAIEALAAVLRAHARKRTPWLARKPGRAPWPFRS